MPNHLHSFIQGNFLMGDGMNRRSKGHVAILCKAQGLTPRFYSGKGIYLKRRHLCARGKMGTSLPAFHSSIHTPPRGLELVAQRKVTVWTWTGWRANDGISILSTPTNWIIQSLPNNPVWTWRFLSPFLRRHWGFKKQVFKLRLFQFITPLSCLSQRRDMSEF